MFTGEKLSAACADEEEMGGWMAGRDAAPCAEEHFQAFPAVEFPGIGEDERVVEAEVRAELGAPLGGDGLEGLEVYAVCDGGDLCVGQASRRKFIVDNAGNGEELIGSSIEAISQG